MQSRKNSNLGFTPLERKLNSRDRFSFLTGFTIVEVLVVLTIFSIVILAVYGVSRGGLEMYRRSQDFDLRERKIVMGLERLAGDLRKTVPLYKFESEVPEEWRFYSESGGGVSEEKHRLTFIVPHRDNLYRLSYDVYHGTGDSFQLRLLQEDIEEGETVLERNLVSGIKKGPSHKFFQYLKYNDMMQDYEWVDEWEEEGLPEAVWAEFAYGPEDEDGEDTQVFTKRIFILQ
jgi:prepilin-type N-terminal cleavage/methylation domain-containing protein